MTSNIDEERRETVSKNANKRILIFASVLIGLSLISALLMPPKEKACDTIGAYIFLQTRGVHFFKSPSTVKFASYPDANIVTADCQIFNIRAYADAQNSFGATVRSYVTATVSFSGDKKELTKFNIIE